MNKPTRSTYTPSDFMDWRAKDALSLTPKFQRRGVWKPAARSFFVDTLIREMPIPPIYIRLIQSPKRDRVIREVVDGQQRVSAVMDFIGGGYRLSRSLQGPWAGKTFDKLSTATQDKITLYPFPSEVFQGITDLEVLEIFSRLNTYSVPLNAQELRNGKFFGVFKQTAYSLAYEHLEFWRKHGIFTERSIARMLEVEFVSEVLIAFSLGMQDKKKSIDDYYESHDEAYPVRARMERRFREIADHINNAFGDDLKETEFSRSPLLYTLFLTLYHRQFGLKNGPFPSPRKAPSKQDLAALYEAVTTLSEKIELGRAHERVPSTYAAFVAACLSQTDNIGPRQTRLKALYSAAFR